ncbi:hypothetical protein ACHAW5_000102 [Stephanodiscus triporus]|uniref:U-box domain-containing protein n=1 Tax=Stephanodiscus triporus TaxID=2934178 RepID=A0ABD3N605_9STRA
MMDPNSIAIEFICPICHVLPFDPVIADDGFIYCKECIDNFILIDQDDSREITSPMTGKPMRATLVISQSVRKTIQSLVQCEGIETGLLGSWAEKQNGETNEISLTKTKAMQGDVKHITILAKWYLFGGKDGIVCDAQKGYFWSKRAADLDNPMCKAYQGVCLVRGCGVEKDWEDGYDLLVETASQELDCEARGKLNFAAYCLGRFYERGAYGFKRNIKKAHKWLAKAQSKPSHVVDTFLQGDQMSESVLLFGTGAPEAIENYGLERDRLSLSTATMSSSSIYSSSAGSSLHEQCPFDELGTAALSVCRRCDECFGKSPLCQACKVIGSCGGGGKGAALKVPPIDRGV